MPDSSRSTLSSMLPSPSRVWAILWISTICSPVQHHPYREPEGHWNHRCPGAPEHWPSLLNWQMAGMLIGGVLGCLGIAGGWLSVLFGSIILYSLANIANGFVETVAQYKVLRLLAGLGLAVNRGAGITLVSEIMSKKNGHGIHHCRHHWHPRCRGCLLRQPGVGLADRLFSSVEDWASPCWSCGSPSCESGLFEGMKASAVQRGNFLSLFFSAP